MSVSIHQFVIVCFFVAVAWAAVGDLRGFKIPNRLVLLVIGFYPAYLVASPVPVDWLGGLTSAAIAFFLGFLAFSRGYIGGGDVKLFAAVALWAGSDKVMNVAVLTMVAGGVLALIFLIHALIRRHGRRRAGGSLPTFGEVLSAPVPYGIAIAIGGAYLTGRLLSIA